MPSDTLSRYVSATCQTGEPLSDRRLVSDSETSNGGTAPKVVTLGAAFSANKGAASMLRAAIDLVYERWPTAEITVLTTYPDEDRASADLPSGVRIVSFSPAELMVVAAPLALAGAMVAPSRRWAGRTEALRELVAADVVLDLAGISFVDGRGVATLGYNSLMTGVGLGLGVPVVKQSQALGPFRTPLVRMAARAILPRVATVCARGMLTRQHLDELGNTRSIDAADLAFCMPTTDADRSMAESLLPSRAGVRTVGIAPSSVVDAYLSKHGGDYTALVREVADHHLAQGDRVVLIPHAIRPGKPASKMNDVPLCQELAAALPGVQMIDGDPTPGELRELVRRTDVLVTSRFHAMVSALATETPPVVLGWSHKYREVLAQFSIDDAALDYRNADAASVTALVRTTFDELDERRERIARYLPAVVESARRNLEPVIELVDT